VNVLIIGIYTQHLDPMDHRTGQMHRVRWRAEQVGGKSTPFSSRAPGFEPIAEAARPDEVNGV
jgi:hypothetical protein